MTAEIWTLGGGKGGTGKTFITSSLGVNLAKSGRKVILIDADLGGANLHSFVRLKKPKHSLTDFFENRLPLEKIIEDTQIPGLKLVTGDIHSINPQNIKYAQKLRFFRHIRELDADYIIVDLGGGSNLNTLDTFLLADKLVVVILPEITSIENLYQFLKKVLFRKINRILRKHRMKDSVLEAWRKGDTRGIHSIGEMIRFLKGLSFETSLIIDEELAGFKVSIILNQVRDREHIEMGFSVRSVIMKYFGISAMYAGYIGHNDLFWRFINQIQPLSQSAVSLSNNREISALARNLEEDKQITLTEIYHA
ncbi:MAG: AAA family ATPase [Candidatus Aminicenantes bacterium]|nr:AAA family ATPase [Candidatus Aminicenantes bacterium]